MTYVTTLIGLIHINMWKILIAQPAFIDGFFTL